MSERTEELKRLYTLFGNDVKTLLTEYPTLENMRVFSDRRNGILDWFGFEQGKKLLLCGSGHGALVGMLTAKGLKVTVLDADSEALSFAEERNSGAVTYVEGTLSDLKDRAEGFDYIVFDGSLKKNAGDDVLIAKQLLLPGGTLIAAADNAYGVRAFCGAEQEENAMAKDTLEALLRTGEEGYLTRYYAEPMRSLPNSIYSDRFLPKAGDLSRVIPAYGFPAYLAVDPGKKYDEICGDGLFPQYADAFVFCWKREAGSADSAVFVKYNRNRREDYQLKTVIRETEDGVKSVEKAALSENGKAHIGAFLRRCALLNGEDRGISYAAPVLSEDGMTAAFPWVKGSSLTEELIRRIRSGESVESVLNEALDMLTGGAAVHNIDAIFDNFLLNEDGCLSGIDYEWVDENGAEPAYIRWRALLQFWLSFAGPLDLGTKEAFLLRFGIDEDMAERFEEKEKAFQKEVAGDEQSVFLDNFTVEVRSGDRIEKTEEALRVAEGRLDSFRAELREKDTTLRKLNEVKRLTDNHVTNLEIIIGNLRNETNELGKTLTYLNRHQTLTSRLRRKAGDAFNKKYPKGSVERKKLEYKKNAILHPIRHHKLTSTPEGRNLIEGDFAIGDIYREHGRLSFPQFEKPLVSIVIPVYNQIGYTYACLVSILEHTKDIPYEVIIADDVSKDATKDLDHFAEGLVISRNTVNQGFLKNCNQAAAKAKGDFIFFLNNDTKVTEGWLDWLLKLMDSDPTIGMTGSKLVYPDGRLQEAGGIIWSDASGWNYGRLQDPSLPEFNYVKDVDYMSGAAILIRTSLWKEIGGFDERYAPAYCEDSDLAFEVRKHGYRVVYQPKSVVIHYEGISNGTDVQGTGLKRYQIENTEKLKAKWKNELALQFENTGDPDPFRARERSGGKKIILVVDHYVPTFDRDAGSRTTWQYLQMFVKKGYQVKFLGDNYAHEEPYTTALQQLGIEVLYGQQMQTGIWEWIERHEKDICCVYLNRPHIASKYIDFIQSRTHLKVIYYGHDLHFLRERREYELTKDRTKKESSEYWKTIELSLMRKADMSYYPSEVECRAIHEIDRSIKVKAITAYLWDEFPESAAEEKPREGFLFVGGFRHPPNADAVLWFVNSVWPKIRAACPDAEFLVAGSGAPEEILSLDSPENGIRILGFVSDEKLAELYRTCRAVIVPLRYGAGVKGKVIEALYYNVPVITTSVGAEGIPAAETVMEIADGEEAFADAAVRIYGDEARLSEMRKNAAVYIREHNSLDAAWEVIREDF